MEDTRAALAKRRRRRWLVLLLLLVVLPLALVGGAWLWLQSAAGEALLKEKVLTAAGDALSGRLEAEAIELQGGHLVLRNLKLFTPEGELVASIDRLEADVDLPALAGQRVHLTRVEVFRPMLLLREDDRGWNLSRALAAKTAGPPPPTPANETRNRWRLELDAVRLVNGLLQLNQEGRRVVASKLAAHGDAKVKLDPLEVNGALELESALTAPLEEKLLAKVTASTTSGPQAYDVEASLGETRLRGRVELPSLQLTLDELVAAPREVSAFVPAYPLKQTVFGKGVLGASQAALQLRAGRAQVQVGAKYDLTRSAAESFSVDGTGLDLQELLGASLPSSLELHAKGALTDWRPDTLGGGLTLTATWDAKGQRLATASLEATATNGAATLTAAEVVAPGVSLHARGTGSRDALSLYARLDAKDLRELDGALRRFASVDTGGLSGNGTLRATLKGKPTQPALSVIGRLTSLAVAGVQVEQLDVDADVPDVTKPLDTDVLLHAKRLRVGERSFDEVTFDFYTHGRELDLDLATRGLGDLKVHVVGVLDRDSRGARLDTAELTWTDATWSLEAPTRVVWGDVIEVAPFALHDGSRRVSGELTMRASRLAAKVHAEQLELSKLPRVVAPASWGLEGTLEVLDVTARGRPSAPAIDFSAKVRRARVLELGGIDLTLSGDWNDGRARGQLQFASEAGALDGTFDVPVFALRDELPEGASASVTLRDLDTRRLAKLLGQELPLHGVLGARATLSGTGDQPKLEVTAESPALTPASDGPLPALEHVVLRAANAEDGRLGLTLGFDAVGGHHEATLATPLTLSALRKLRLDRATLLAQPFELTLRDADVDVHRLAELGGVVDDELSGRATLTGALHGPADRPTGELSLALVDVNLPPLKQARLDLTLRADDTKTRLTGSGALAGKPAVELTSAVATTPSALLAPLLEGQGVDAVIDAAKDSALEGLLTLQPFELAQAFPAAAEGKTPPGGVVSTTLALGGTLEAPTARLTGTVTNLRFERVALGSARFDLRSTGVEQSYAVALGGQGRDDFKLKGTTGLDVRLSSLQRGLAWRSAPVDLSLEARNFDLGFLSGSIDLLRIVGGRLDLTGRVHGTLGEPGFVGDATLTRGRLALAGLGDYRDLELSLHATNDVVDVKQLALKSGGGKAELVAHAERQRSGAWALTSQGSTEKLPIVNDDQLLATVSLRYQLEGDATSSLVDVHALSLPRVEVELPEVKRKDLQDLQRPKDVIVLRGGARPTKRQREQAKTESTAPADEGLTVRAVLDAPRNLWVKSSDLNIELGLSEGFRVEYHDGTQLFGDARIIQGNIEVIGREFSVQKGSEARFAGPATKPLVNVSALHVNQREQVKITVTVTGKGTDVALKATSEPPMPESDLYAVLATGRRTLKNSGSATITPGAAASVVGQLAASQLKTVIAKKLPLDLFNFETSDDFQRVKLDVGWYLSDTLFLGGSVHVGARRERGENVFSSRLEFQMTRAVTLEAYAGDALSFGADAVWSRDF